MAELLRRGHFLGAKLRSIRRRNGLTLEELSVRCIQHKPDLAPSVSYLSMIESGKRTPSAQLLELLAGIFQRPPAWFLDENAALDLPAPAAGGRSMSIPLEPAFLFSRSLPQPGAAGRQSSHLLIHSLQEMSRNGSPDLERAAGRIGKRRFPLAVEDL